MTWLLYNVCAFLTLGKLAIKTFKLTKASHVTDITMAGRDLLICWTIFMLIFGLQVCGIEYMLKWFPGYYYIKSSLLIVVAWPQLRLGRLLFFDFIRPSAEYVDQRLCDLNVRSPENLFEVIPLVLAVLIFPKLAERREPRILSQEEYYQSSIPSKVKSTSKKLSVLTDYLDELELRTSTLQRDRDESKEEEKELGHENLPAEESQAIFTRLSIISKSPYKSPTSKPEDLSINEDSFSFPSPRHNRRSSLEMLQSILRKQASSTLELFKTDQRNNDLRHEFTERSQSRERSARPPSRTRQRRLSKENLLLMDPIEMSRNVTSRRQLRSSFVRGPTSVFQMPENLFEQSSTRSGRSFRQNDTGSFRSKLSAARDSIGKDIDSILRGIRRPSHQVGCISIRSESVFAV
jgi:cell division protein ZapA (FtsZ GTPase activity inhibitor)